MVPILFTSITKDRSQVDLDNPEYALRYVLAVAENISFKVTQILQAYYHQIRLTGFFFAGKSVCFFSIIFIFQNQTHEENPASGNYRNCGDHFFKL